MSEFALIHATRYDDDDLGSALATVVCLLEPENSLARIVSAYYAWEGLEVDKFDEQLLSMQSLVDAGAEVGAAAIMIDRLIDRSNDFDESLPPGSQTHDLDALRLAVSVEPTWVENHSRLAAALVLQDDVQGARHQLDMAIVNALGAAASEKMTLREASFHLAFTGRLSSKHDLRLRREALGG